MLNLNQFSYITTSEISIRYFDHGPKNGQAIILVHGWPESWYSWRKQIIFFASLGYRMIVPDVRGYGGSSKPDQVSDYTMKKLIQDLLDLNNHVCGTEKKPILIGHDWGAPIVWNTAALYPERIKGVAGLSVPFSPRGKISSLALWKSLYKNRFFYQLYFQRIGIAEKELDYDITTSLKKIYFSGSGEAPSDVFASYKNSKGDMLSGLPEPTCLPDWLQEKDLEYYVSQFKKDGFKPSIQRYRAQEIDWIELTELSRARITIPSCFIAGEKDNVLKFVPGVDLVEKMKNHMDDLKICKIIDNVGHWVQQEAADEVNSILSRFFTMI